MKEELINIHAAKTQLSKLVTLTEKGITITLCRRGVPCAQIVPLKPKRRKPGLWGSINIDFDFFRSLPESELKAWEK